MNARMANASYSMPRTSPPGTYFNVWNMNMKYHSGLMSGVGRGEGIAFSPSSQGKSAASAANTPQRTVQAMKVAQPKSWGRRASAARRGTDR